MICLELEDLFGRAAAAERCDPICGMRGPAALFRPLFIEDGVMASAELFPLPLFVFRRTGMLLFDDSFGGRDGGEEDILAAETVPAAS